MGTYLCAFWYWIINIHMCICVFMYGIVDMHDIVCSDMVLHACMHTYNIVLVRILHTIVLYMKCALSLLRLLMRKTLLVLCGFVE